MKAPPWQLPRRRRWGDLAGAVGQALLNVKRRTAPRFSSSLHGSLIRILVPLLLLNTLVSHTHTVHTPDLRSERRSRSQPAYRLAPTQHHTRKRQITPDEQEQQSRSPFDHCNTYTHTRQHLAAAAQPESCTNRDISNASGDHALPTHTTLPDLPISCPTPPEPHWQTMQLRRT